MYCDKCGKAMNDSDRFCAGCGAPAAGPGTAGLATDDSATRYVGSRAGQSDRMDAPPATGPKIPVAGAASIPPIPPMKPAPRNSLVPSKRKKRNPFVIIAPIAAAAVVVAVAVFVVFGGGTPNPIDALPPSVVSRIVPADESGEPLEDYTVRAKDRNTGKPVGEPLRVKDGQGFAPHDLGLDDKGSYDFDIVDNGTNKSYGTTWPVARSGEGDANGEVADGNGENDGDVVGDDGEGGVILALDELAQQSESEGDGKSLDAADAEQSAASAGAKSDEAPAKSESSDAADAKAESAQATDAGDVDGKAAEDAEGSDADGLSSDSDGEDGDVGEASDGASENGEGQQTPKQTETPDNASGEATGDSVGNSSDGGATGDDGTGANANTNSGGTENGGANNGGTNNGGTDNSDIERDDSTSDNAQNQEKPDKNHLGTESMETGTEGDDQQADNTTPDNGLSTQSAYATVVKDLEAQYSDVGLKNVGSGESGLQYAAGVPMVAQMDFDADGTDELLVAYWDGATSADRNGTVVAQQAIAVYACDKASGAASKVSTTGNVSYGNDDMPVVLVAEPKGAGERFLVERPASSSGSGAPALAFKRYDSSAGSFASLTNDEAAAKGLTGQGGAYTIVAYELGKRPGDSSDLQDGGNSLGFTATVRNYDAVRQMTDANVRNLTGEAAPVGKDDEPVASDDSTDNAEDTDSVDAAISGDASSDEALEEESPEAAKQDDAVDDASKSGESAEDPDGESGESEGSADANADEGGSDVNSYAGPSESDLENTAKAFGEAWYGGWDFDGDEMVVSDELTGERVAGYIEPESSLYEDALDSSSPDSVFFANAGLHADNVEAEALGDGKCRIDVDYVGVQQEIDRETYERDVAERLQHASWILTFNEEGLVTDVEAA